MFCTNCGKQIPDDSLFCEHCGTKNDLNFKSAAPQPKKADEKVDKPKETVNEQPSVTPNVNVEPKKPMSKKAKMGLFGGIGAGILAIIIIIIIAVTPKTINIGKFIVFDLSGYDGYGRASAYIDWDAFEQQYRNKISFTNQVQNNSFGLTNLVNPVDVVKSNVYLEQSSFDYLSNGDTVTVNVVVSDEIQMELKNKFGNLSASFSISGLGELTKIDLLSVLEEPYVTFSGPNTQTYAKPKYKGEENSTYEDNGLVISVVGNGDSKSINIVKDNQLLSSAQYIVEEDGPFSNGDVVTLRVTGIDGLLEQGYGPKENSIKVPVADRPELITDESMLSAESIRGFVTLYVYRLNTEYGYTPYSDDCYRNETTNNAFAMVAKSSTVTDSPFSVLIDFSYERAYPGYRRTYTTNYNRYMIMHNVFVDNNCLDCTSYEAENYWRYDNIWDFINDNSNEYDFIQLKLD